MALTKTQTFIKVWRRTPTQTLLKIWDQNLPQTCPFFEKYGCAGFGSHIRADSVQLQFDREFNKSVKGTSYYTL
eukprot:scaffold50556_cov72-Attheya_sp.AAC.3